ncbi:hypothetical protein AC579_6716 [Pseudocercospora musae]|uniref:Uncharacterized protein n=1 Tax=Pseudocercospora musae TaxID=113226 RepID=A0A139II29_9PEZI|nr:hypothetical protein AC579_6716 [Pseudocercospora musae]
MGASTRLSNHKHNKHEQQIMGPMHLRPSMKELQARPIASSACTAHNPLRQGIREIGMSESNTQDVTHVISLAVEKSLGIAKILHGTRTLYIGTSQSSAHSTTANGQDPKAKASPDKTI